MSGLGIIGRERMLVDKLAKLLQDTAANRHAYTNVHDSDRGAWFDVELYDGPEPTGRIARVSVELLRVDKPGALTEGSA